MPKNLSLISLHSTGCQLPFEEAGSQGRAHIGFVPQTNRINRFTPQAGELCHAFAKQATHSKASQNAASAANYCSQEAAKRRVTNLSTTRNQVKRRIELGFTLAAAAEDDRHRGGSNMKHLYPTISMLILTSCAVICAASSEEEGESAEGSSEQDGKTEKQHQQGIRLISFDTVDKDIAIGLDYLLPFVKVPVKRKRYGPPRVSNESQDLLQLSLDHCPCSLWS